MSFDKLHAATTAIANATGRLRHEVAIVLGSGLSDYATGLPGAVEVPYKNVPDFPVPRVEGHGGSVVSAALGTTNVLVLSGRVHFYEGWTLDQVVFGVRTAIMSGCRTVVLTNAAGGIRKDLTPGDLVLITDHINLTGRNPLMGDNDSRLGVRFPDMTEVYDKELLATARRTATQLDMPLAEGVYAWFTGPCYETPAEVRMAAVLGGDLAGMSTVPEAIAARHMGARVLGISLVTNHAAGLSSDPLAHEEVTEIGAEARPRFARLLNALLPELGR